ncbi:MAG: polysulfide reductase NrfD [Candidatus Kapabacteria bacterium]|nr:polysulfide reductase NrfD [Candidatus Kapabacteria bacterium]
MHELVNTRHNLQIDPHLHIWGWEIGVYLFLGGLVAGMMIISGFFIFTGRTKNTKCSCFLIPIIALIAISLGMLSLFLDLEHKLYVWRMYLTFQWTSPMSWGAWILLLVYPVLIVNVLLKLPEELYGNFPHLRKISEYLNSSHSILQTIGMISMIIGASLGMYTGVLLSALGARPLWNSSMLWILFLTSGLSSAAAFIHLVAREEEERRMLAKADNSFLIFEFVVIMLLLVGFLTSDQVHIEAVKLLLSGEYSAIFWVFVVSLGIVIPLIIQLMAVNNKIRHTVIAPIMVMLGGLILRFVIVSAGQASHWSGQVFR